MPGVLGSIMEEVLKGFEGQAFKKESLINGLKNRGVKDAELEQSGAKAFIQDHPSDKVPTNDVVQYLKDRPDGLKTENYGPKVYEKPTGDTYTSDAAFNSIRENAFTPKNLRNTADEIMSPNEPLKQGRYSISINQQPEAHGIDNHFDDPNYYSHVRMTDVPGDARYVHEIQSDVHGAGDKYTKGLGSDAEDRALNNRSNEESLSVNNIIAKHKNDLIDYLGKPDFGGDTKGDWLESAKHEVVDNAYSTPLNDLIGSQVSRLQGTEGIHHIMRVLNVTDETAAKMQPTIVEEATRLERDHSINFDSFASSRFDKKDPNWLNNTINKLLVDSSQQGQNTLKFRIAPDRNLMRAQGVQKWYENDVSNTLYKTAKKIGAKIEKTPDGYIKMQLPDNFKLPLYGVLATTLSSKNKGN